MNLREFFERYGVSLGVLGVLALLIALLPGNASTSGDKVGTTGNAAAGRTTAGGAAPGEAQGAGGTAAAAGGSTGAATSTGRVPGRRCTFLTVISIRSNW